MLTIMVTQLPLGIGFNVQDGDAFLAVHHFNRDPQGRPWQIEASGLIKVGDQVRCVAGAGTW